MSKIRINDLARELEVKSKVILDTLIEVGVTEKKTHSSSVEEHEAEKVRAHIRGASEAQASAKSSRPGRAEADGIKTKIDLSQISKPGDVLKAIISKHQPPAAPATRPVVATPVEAKPAAPRTVVPSPPPAPAAPSKFVVPQTGVRPILYSTRATDQAL